MKLVLNSDSGRLWQAKPWQVEGEIQYYRKPHDPEIASYDAGDFRYMGAGYRAGKVRTAASKSPMPEVYRLMPDHQTPLECQFQKLWRELNPKLSDDRWSTLGNDGLAFCNHGTGFPYRHNCITGENADASLLTFDAPRVCGGAILKGVELDGCLQIESILTSQLVPSAADVLRKPWLWFWMTSINRDGEINLVMRQAIDGTMIPVRIPLITRQPVNLPLSYLHKLPKGMPLPEPTWMA